jgi:hypothetical protein
MTERLETPSNYSASEKIAYLVGRRDALNSFYVVVTNKPHLLREQSIELLRHAILEADRKIKKETDANNT